MAEPIKAIIGLGNPGRQYYFNRHSIGFRVVDALVERHAGSWRTREDMEVAELTVNGNKIFLIKPQTFMNNSGRVISWLTKQGIKPENILVIHDELEQPFGKLAIKKGGSARGHNGLRSIIAACGEEFNRLRFGIGRPEQKEMVSSYVLQDFTEDATRIIELIDAAVTLIEEQLL
jgi:peptidyl-tRNA hydrolase, PTH1 family